ncbi:ribokinase [Labrys okinawensis]|uniref:Ribokinase n=2 Tax=Labrys okinawensis TaxID=346911 RepID=A0A2S9QCL3_9HYPH|nr:ribokinase [Labrys okinawensis]
MQEPMKTGRPVICVGATTVDQVLEIDEMPRQAVKVTARHHFKRGGGPAATAAVACARLLQPAELWSRLGNDAEAAFLCERLRRHGVGIEGVKCSGEMNTITAVVIVDRQGERFIVGHDHTDLPASAAHLPLQDIARAGAVLADINWHEASLAALDAAAAAGVPSVLDAEVTDPVLLLELARRASLPVFSEEGFALASDGGQPDAKGCDALSRRLGGTFGVTLGARGSLWWVDDVLTLVPALPVNVLDTTGAGDVFHGALAAGLAEGRPVIDAARFASAAASLKCELGNGWDGMPERQAVVEAAARLDPLAVS